MEEVLSTPAELINEDGRGSPERVTGSTMSSGGGEGGREGGGDPLGDGGTIGRDSPVSFSFRIASNLLVSNADRQRLLATDSVEERLRYDGGRSVCVGGDVMISSHLWTVSDCFVFCADLSWTISGGK